MKQKNLSSNPVSNLQKKCNDQGLHSPSDSEEDHDTVDEIAVKTHNPKQQRNSISAEVYGQWNKKELFNPRVIPKSEEVQQKISSRLETVFMFSILEPKEKQIVMLAMEERKVKAGEWVIIQGEEGNELYVIESGNLDCYKKFADKPEPQFLKTYVPGEFFGELALLYNAPRAAQIKAKTDCVLWALDRETFNHIVRDASVKRRALYEEFLKNWTLIKTITDPYDKYKIADVFISITTTNKQKIFGRGDKEGAVVVVESGEVVAIDEKGNYKFKYGKGDYFGEIPVLYREKTQPFNFVVNADGTKLLKITPDSYRTTLHSIEDILKENAKKYNDYI